MFIKKTHYSRINPKTGTVYTYPVQPKEEQDFIITYYAILADRSVQGPYTAQSAALYRVRHE